MNAANAKRPRVESVGKAAVVLGDKTYRFEDTAALRGGGTTSDGESDEEEGGFVLVRAKSRKVNRDSAATVNAKGAGFSPRTPPNAVRVANQNPHTSPTESANGNNKPFTFAQAVQLPRSNPTAGAPKRDVMAHTFNGSAQSAKQPQSASRPASAGYRPRTAAAADKQMTPRSQPCTPSHPVTKPTHASLNEHHCASDFLI